MFAKRRRRSKRWVSLGALSKSCVSDWLQRLRLVGVTSTIYESVSEASTTCFHTHCSNMCECVMSAESWWWLELDKVWFGKGRGGGGSEGDVMWDDKQSGQGLFYTDTSTSAVWEDTIIYSMQAHDNDAVLLWWVMNIAARIIHLVLSAYGPHIRLKLRSHYALICSSHYNFELLI